MFGLFNFQSSQPRSTNGKFATKDAQELVNFSITNPLPALKAWVNKILANEGIGVDFRLKIHPLTAIALALSFTLGGFGIARLNSPLMSAISKHVPFLSFLAQSQTSQVNAQPQQAISAPLPEVNPIRETAFTGILRFSSATKKFYLETRDAEAIPLEVPKNVTDLTKYIGRRIFAAGDLNTKTGILTVTDA